MDCGRIAFNSDFGFGSNSEANLGGADVPSCPRSGHCWVHRAGQFGANIRQSSIGAAREFSAPI